MSGQHSVLSPSGAHRRVRCVGSLAATKGMESPPSIYSAEGTAYHEIAAKALMGGYDVDKWVGFKVQADGFEFTITEEGAAHAQAYVDAIRRLPSQHFYEVRVDTSAVVGVPGQGGTVDALTLDYENSTIHVDDLKFGFRPVVAKDNEQLIEYAAAALYKHELEHDWQFVRVAIHQPRGAVKYSEHIYTVDELRAHMLRIAKLEQTAHKLWLNTPSDLAKYLTLSEKGCEWCPIRATCKARADQILGEFPLSEPGQPKQNDYAIRMTDAELAKARDRVDRIEAWCADIKTQAHARALAGATIPGWKLVAGRKGNRKWVDEKLAEEVLTTALGDAAYKPRTIISPADADKALKKNPPILETLRANQSQTDGALSLERDDSPKESVNVQPLEFPIQEPPSHNQESVP